MQTHDLLSAVRAAYYGGQEILKIYESDFEVELKADESPLTLADKNAHERIELELAETGIPILSEEGASIPYEERSKWQYFWLVDPLDGTKEFVKRNGEFTVNIALIHDQISVAGVIYVPVKNWLYYNLGDQNSFVIRDFIWREGMTINDLETMAASLPENLTNDGFKVVGSRSHMNEETEKFIQSLESKHDKIDIVSMGSSLKICLVAEGSAHVYPRFAPTMEWDTAAGHAIVKGAGKNIVDRETGSEMLYNKKNLLNNWFLVE